jgi:hypothetical protein
MDNVHFECATSLREEKPLVAFLKLILHGFTNGANVPLVRAIRPYQ